MASAGSFASIIKKRQKDWDCPELMSRATADTGKKLPFSSPLLNWCTYGGIPRDAYTEFFGAPGGGKSTTSMDICKNAIATFRTEYQQQLEEYRKLVDSGKKEYQGPYEDLQDRGPQKVLYVDLENSFDLKWACTLGISKSDIVDDDSVLNIMSVPNVAAEEVLQTVMDVMETGEVGLVILDSIPSLVPRQELEKQMGERTVASLAGCLTVFFRKVIPILKRYHCTLLAINQIRDNMDNPYVTKTPGGNAPKFYASMRMEFRIGKPVDAFGNELPMNTEDPAGYLVNAKLVKQKTAPSDRRMGTYYLMFDGGIRPDFDYAKLAVNKYQFIRKTGGWFTMCDPYTGEILETESGAPVKVHGMPRVYQYLKENEQYYASIRKYITEDLNGEDHVAEQVVESDDELEDYTSAAV